MKTSKQISEERASKYLERVMTFEKVMERLDEVSISDLVKEAFIEGYKTALLFDPTVGFFVESLDRFNALSYNEGSIHVQVESLAKITQKVYFTKVIEFIHDKEGLSYEQATKLYRGKAEAQIRAETKSGDGK